MGDRHAFKEKGYTKRPKGREYFLTKMKHKTHEDHCVIQPGLPQVSPLSMRLHHVSLTGAFKIK